MAPRNLSKIPPSLQLLQVQGGVQGIATLVGRRLEKTLTIKRRVWDLAMFTTDTEAKKKTPEDHYNLNILVFLINCELKLTNYIKFLSIFQLASKHLNVAFLLSRSY